uniref:F3H2 protein n=1 Tax=Reaumuria trigyna TaxID=1091135 RepID=W0S9B2_9CARY|nr:F3H2 protein [Reaumuria trigyna]
MATSSILDLGTKPTRSVAVSSVKELANLKSIPSSYVHPTMTNCEASDSRPDDGSIPIIDFSLLVSDDPDERSRMIEELGKACRNWGFFMVVNHGVGVDLMQAILDDCNEFFNLTTEEKLEFQGKHVLDPIRYGTSFNASVEKSYFWRDFLKAFVHPLFNFPNKPPGFSELANEYCSKIRRLTNELLKGISASLGLEPSYIAKALNLESSLQIFITNYYPPCPEPELAIGIAPHSDHGILTLLIQNGIGGLQIMHDGRWVEVNPISNSLLVNTGDHLEILSNGKYKSVLHRAVVNNKATRISLAVADGPSLDAIVSPAPELLDSEENLAKYRPMKYKEYLVAQQSNPISGKSALDRVRI